MALDDGIPANDSDSPDAGLREMTNDHCTGGANAQRRARLSQLKTTNKILESILAAVQDMKQDVDIFRDELRKELKEISRNMAR
ncbi:MAG TPA: hypothetical protein VGV12_15045 [Gemmatimonadales bacterium]|nr:hypothetical protein [Gemmatimonadales bacterium]